MRWWMLRAMRAELRARKAEHRAALAERVVQAAIKRMSDDELLEIRQEIGGDNDGAGNTG